MNPLTALGLIAACLSIMLHSRGRLRPARALFGVLVMIGVGKLLEATLGSPAIDNLLFYRDMSPEVYGPGRMAPNTAACFILLGFAGLLLALGHRFCLASQIVSACVALIALFAVVGYMFGVPALYTVVALRPMAVNTSVGLLVSAICLAGVQRCGLVAILREGGPAGAMARSVLPIAVLVPILVGGARLWGEQASLYGLEAGVAISVVANVTLTCGLMAFAIFMIHRSDKARLEREAALRHSQEFAQVGHVHWSDPDPRPTWSEEAFRIHGLSAGSEAPTLLTWPELVHPEDRDGFRDYLATARLTGLEREWRGRVVHPDGEIRQVRVHLAADNIEGERDSLLFGIVPDVMELEVARRRAEHASRAKAAFLANMSHELRTPLNGILGFSELLMGAGLDEEHHEHASLVHRSANALLHLLNDILDFSKIEAGAVEIAPGPTRLADLLQECLSLVQPAARAKGVETFLHLHEDVPACAMVDALRLRQILLNLLGNAVKFTDKGFIALEASRSELGGKDQLVIGIEDTGVGIPADRQQAIFGEFVQADPSVAQRFGGTGLGLSISRRLAKLLGGSLTLESEPGRGTKVELTLPFVPVNKQPARAEPPPPRSEGGSSRILLVEDDLLNQRLATAILNRLGHEVEIAANGVEAVNKMHSFELGESEFDLVFMDLQLPDLDGLTATRQIRQLGPRASSVPIIALSANAYASDVAACLDAGMDAHLAKPFSIQGLTRAVDRWSRREANAAVPSISPEIVESLVPMFLEQCKDAADMVAELQAALDVGPGANPTKLAARVMDTCHQLVGTAASFGQTQLGRVAAETEECLAGLAGTDDFAKAYACVGDLRLQLAAALDAPTSVAA